MRGVVVAQTTSRSKTEQVQVVGGNGASEYACRIPSGFTHRPQYLRKLLSTDLSTSSSWTKSVTLDSTRPIQNTPDMTPCWTCSWPTDQTSSPSWGNYTYRYTVTTRLILRWDGRQTYGDLPPSRINFVLAVRCCKRKLSVWHSSVDLPLLTQMRALPQTAQLRRRDITRVSTRHPNCAPPGVAHESLAVVYWHP